MAAVHGISWDDRKRRTVTAVATATAVLLSAGAFATAAHAEPRLVSVIVRAQPNDGAAADRQITALGGHIQEQVGLINAVVADVPATAVQQLSASSDVAQVTANVTVNLLSSSTSSTGSYNPVTDVDSMYNIEQMDGAHAYWNAGYTGQGVGVALVDSGVTPVDGLSAPGKVIYGPDLSYESQYASLANLDTYGHGTHMAGIIAGRDDEVTTVSSSDTTHFLGMAPNAHIVSLKVANALGQTSVSQVLTAIASVVQHRNDNGLNIRVLNLSFGTPSHQSYVLEPLAYAAEQAWLHGIVVVVSAGNDGHTSDGLEDPAVDPYVIAVGATDTEGTTNVAQHEPASFTSQGNSKRSPDLGAPGTHVVSLRDPGSFIDDTFGATATVGGRFLLGSGTSQAAAIVSGAAALLISQRPSLTPDQVKALLVDHTSAIKGNSRLTGSGELNLAAVLNAPTPTVTQRWRQSTAGYSDPSGDAPYTGASWSGASWSGASWSGASWSSVSWSGSSWSDYSWS